jgi:hypothetical protein
VLSHADCLSRDDVVVRNAASPSGWSFRSSPQSAVRLYLELIHEYPAAGPARAIVFQRLSQLLTTTPNVWRVGRGLDDASLVFGAFGTIDSDTLLFAPYPVAELRVGGQATEASTTVEGLTRQRAILRSVALEWVRDFPRDPDAHACLAQALEANGEVTAAVPGGMSALSEVSTARRLEKTQDGSGHRLVLEAMQIRLLVKSNRFAEARIAAESLLRTIRTPAAAQAESIAAIAALVGHLRQALDFGRVYTPEYALALPTGYRYHPPLALAEATVALFTFSTFGGPADSILALRARVDTLLGFYTGPSERATVRDALLGRSLSMAAPVVGPEAVAQIDSSSNYLIALEQELQRGDRSGVLRNLTQVEYIRRRRSPGATSLDATYLESWLRASAGDTVGALRRADETLDALPATGDEVVTDMALSTSLERLMVLRADLSAARDPNKVRWSAAACELWRGADSIWQQTEHRLCTAGRQ